MTGCWYYAAHDLNNLYWHEHQCALLQRTQDSPVPNFTLSVSSNDAACIAAGAVPIPGAKTVEQVTEHLGALDWALDDNEVGMLDERLDALKA